MKVVGTIIVACTALAIYTTNLNAYNYIFLKGKGVGGEMMCSDWIRASKTNPRETAAMTQWVFGFVTGYDTAIRPNPATVTLMVKLSPTRSLRFASKIQGQI